MVEHRRPLWLLGFTIFISSNIFGSLAQIASLPVVILAPLGALSLLWNAFFARLLLGDVFSPWMILGTILIAGGAVLIAIFGIVPEPTRSIEDLLELFRRPAFVAYFSTLGTIVFLCLTFTHIIDFSLSRQIAKTGPCALPPTSNPDDINLLLPPSSIPSVILDSTNSTIPSEQTPLLDRKAGTTSPSSFKKVHNDHVFRSIHRTRMLLAISYASFSGILSGMCLLFAKSGVELLLLTLSGHNQFWRWEAWVLVLGLVIFALLQLWYLHKGLTLADPTLVCPSAFCFYNLSSIVNGLVYFDQFSLIPPLHLGLVMLGIVVLLAGVWVVSIHSGGGGVDVGAWSEEDHLEDLLRTSEEPESYETEGGRENFSLDFPTAETSYSGRFGPISVEGETRLLNTASSPETAGVGLDVGREQLLHSPSATTDPSTETHVYPTPNSPPYQVLPQRRRLTTNASSQTRHSRVTSHSHSVMYSNSPVSPPLGPVSTLGTGFQIGLSPVSPGFTLMPRERRRRISGLGLGAPTSFADVVVEAMAVEERERRRTVSEGDIRDRVEMHQSEDSPVETVAEVGGRSEHHDNMDIRGRTSRWKWLKKVITGRG